MYRIYTNITISSTEYSCWKLYFNSSPTLCVLCFRSVGWSTYMKLKYFLQDLIPDNFFIETSIQLDRSWLSQDSVTCKWQKCSCPTNSFVTNDQRHIMTVVQSINQDILNKNAGILWQKVTIPEARVNHSLIWEINTCSQAKPSIHAGFCNFLWQFLIYTIDVNVR